jgi:hypothetical protein
MVISRPLPSLYLLLVVAWIFFVDDGHEVLSSPTAIPALPYL